MYISLAQEGNDPIVAPIVGVGGTLRVGVGSADGERSSVWRIWANPSKSDVYVAARNIVRVQKFSLHESGDYRYAWITREIAQEHTGEEQRIVDRWRRPDLDPSGWNLALSILVASEDVVAIPGPRETADVRWLPKPPPGRTRRILVMMVTPDLGGIPTTGAVVVEALALANGNAVIVLTDEIETPDAHLVAQANVRRETESLGVDLRQPGMRMGMFGHGDDGVRFVWDTAHE